MQGLDALIITGAHIEDADLKKAPFFPAQRVLLNMSIALKLHDCMTSQSLL
jgi:hypothetical protein